MLMMMNEMKQIKTSDAVFTSWAFDFIFQFDDNLMKPLKAILPSTNAEARLLISASNNRSKR